MVVQKNPFLCLKCRRTGHVAKKCKQEYPRDFYSWFVSSQRAEFSTTDTRTLPKLCKRCRDLDIVGYLEQDIPWKTSIERPSHEELDRYIYNLGKVGSIKFREDCPLCRCLFALTPTPMFDDEEILMCPNWNLTRLEGGVALDTPEKRRSAKGILLTLASSYGADFSKDSILDRGDSMTLLQQDLSDNKSALGGRRISPSIDLDLIHHWLAKCTDLHPITCTPMWSEELRTIRLVDVVNRRLVSHPGTPCSYIALSYVLGHVEQIVCKLGPLPKNLPKTIDDSIDLVLQLGIQYLWVDTLCIDQSESEEKHAQIRKMDLIYRGAYATIISLSGSSAEDGLPRFGKNSQCTPQLSCRIGDKTLVTLMPTLSQQIFTTRWGSRAWTLQEALLSRRCIYLSNEQMYFECNAMQCCESLDESRSWVHNTYRDAEFLVAGHSEPAIGAGVLRSPFTGTSKSIRNDRFGMYVALTNLYNYRYMTYQSDALNAFSGIVQYLQEAAYPRGFFWGLPLEDFNWALSWVNRGVTKRRQGFPSWSWTGWQGRKWGGEVFDLWYPQKWPTFLRVFRIASNGELSPIFESEHRLAANDADCARNKDPGENTREGRSSNQDNDHLLSVVNSIHLPMTPPFNFDGYDQSLSRQLLVIEGITLIFHPACTEVHCYAPCEYVYWKQPLTGDNNTEPVSCILYGLEHDKELEDLASSACGQHSFLLLGRQRNGRNVWFTLMTLKEWERESQREDPGKVERDHTSSETSSTERLTLDERIMTRGTVVHLIVPEEEVSSVIGGLRPEKQTIVLI